MSAALTVLGVGSPFGDDCVGWSAAALLAASPLVANGADQIDVRILDRPGSLLLAEFSQSMGVIVIDALISGAVPGTILRLGADGVRAARSLVSSHDLGVAQAVGLARSLGSLPERFVFFGIETDRQHTGTGLSPAVSAALPQLVEQVIQQAVAWRAAASEAAGAAVG
jgi:hydrogenase maturation protease